MSIVHFHPMDDQDMPALPDPLISIDHLAAGLFALALIHTFAARQFERLSHRYPRHAGLFHLLGEVEVVFGFWAIVLVLAMALLQDGASALAYAESRNYTEPLFVFVVMVIAASRPVLDLVMRVIAALSGITPLPRPLVSAWLGLVPRQYSSGGKTRLGRITKAGDAYLRTLFVQGARAVIEAANIASVYDGSYKALFSTALPAGTTLTATSNLGPRRIVPAK